MPRKKTPAELRNMNIAATKLLTSTIRARSGLHPARLEHEFKIGSEGFREEKSGMQWRRYERGGREMCPEQRDRIARVAFQRRWIPDERPPLYLDELRAWGSIRELFVRRICGEQVNDSQLAAHRAQWQTWFRSRRETMHAEAKALPRLIVRVMRELEALRAFLQRIDGSGHDYWIINPFGYDAGIRDLCNVEAECCDTDEFIQKIDELIRLANSIELKVLYALAADVVPPPTFGQEHGIRPN